MNDTLPHVHRAAPRDRDPGEKLFVQKGLLDVKHDPLIVNHNITFIGPVFLISKQISPFDLISDFDQVL